MTPSLVTLSDAVRANLLIGVYVTFWIFVPVSFACVCNYALKQFRAGTLVDGLNAPLPFAISAVTGWSFVVMVLGLIFLQSPLYLLVVMVGAFGLLVETGRSANAQFGLTRLSPTRLVSWSLLIFGAIMLVEAPLTEALTWLFKEVHLPSPEQESVESFRKIDRPSKILEFVIVAAFISPVIEELFFRGFLIAFLKKYTSTWAALVLSAGVFAFVHLNIGAALPLWFLGMALGLAYEHTGSLLLPIGIHACWNLVTALAIMLEKVHT